jgi:hypothetical protein
MTYYKAVLFAADGDWVTDYRNCESVEEVQLKLAEQGSRWYFYPFHAVIRDNGGLVRRTQRIVDAAYPFEEMKGCTIKTFSRMIADTPDEELLAILS